MTEILEQVKTGAKKAQGKVKKKEDLSYLQKMKYHTQLMPACDKISANRKKLMASLKKLQQDLKRYQLSVATGLTASKASAAESEKAVKESVKNKDDDKYGFLMLLLTHSQVITRNLQISNKASKDFQATCVKMEKEL